MTPPRPVTSVQRRLLLVSTTSPLRTSFPAETTSVAGAAAAASDAAIRPASAPARPVPSGVWSRSSSAVCQGRRLPGKHRACLDGGETAVRGM